MRDDIAMFHAHEDHQSVDPLIHRPIETREALAMSGNDREGCGYTAVRERNAGETGRCQRGGYTGDDLRFNAMLGEKREFLTAAAKYHRVATLQADDEGMGVGQSQKPIEDFRLHLFLLALLLAGVDQCGLGIGKY